MKIDREKFMTLALSMGMLPTACVVHTGPPRSNTGPHNAPPAAGKPAEAGDANAGPAKTAPAGPASRDAQHPMQRVRGRSGTRENPTPTKMAPTDECVNWDPKGECIAWAGDDNGDIALPADECVNWDPSGECIGWAGDGTVAPADECVQWDPSGECTGWEERDL